MIGHFNSLSVEAIKRTGGKDGMEGRRELVKAKKSGREQSARLKSARLSPLDKFLGQKSRRTKVPRIFKFSSRILPRILLRMFPEFFEEFSCFVSWETETRKNSPKIPAIFQCKIPRQIRKKYSQNFSGEEAKQQVLGGHGESLRTKCLCSLFGT